MTLVTLGTLPNSDSKSSLIESFVSDGQGVEVGVFRHAKIKRGVSVFLNVDSIDFLLEARLCWAFDFFFFFFFGVFRRCAIFTLYLVTIYDRNVPSMYCTEPKNCKLYHSVYPTGNAPFLSSIWTRQTDAPSSSAAQSPHGSQSTPLRGSGYG
jgi:hypothetical protein